ncbi:uncharacterized protein LOC130766937 [Actinidia eriantha]|uniref:uncharacterized protein LOC130766937 n=1 Tax=Actinidia eriantha TaxID=165200 RepID=UPI002585441A|nr:uncharacterized protein LOC130766937 [Actinidia eriantha]
MAVAGLQNVSVINSPFHGESQSPLSSRWGNHDTRSTRASSLLQMWREIEGEHVVSNPQLRVGDGVQYQRIDNLSADLVNAYFSEKQDSDDGDSLEDRSENSNESRTWSQGQMWLQNEHEDGNSTTSEQSINLGEVERRRVRQIFQEWRNSGVRGHAPDVSSVNRSSRAQWLGENERERVRVIREWVQVTSQQSGTCAGRGEEQPPEIGEQIERVRDGLVVNRCAVGARRNIRRLCGRQALLDLLAKAKRERQRELQSLLEHRPVSDFAHRNRIQSLLRGRFLQSGRLVQDEQPSSPAASELGLLRQRHSVSGLREGFLIRLDNVVDCPSSGAQSDTSSAIDINDFINQQTQTKRSQGDLDAIREQSEHSNGETDTNELHTVPLEGNTGQQINWQEANAPEERQLDISENDESKQLNSSNFLPFGRRDDLGENAGGNWEENIANAWLPETSGSEVKEQNYQLVVREALHEQYKHSGEEHNTHASLDCTDCHESNTIETMHCPHPSEQEQWQESVTDNEDDGWQQQDNMEFTGWRDDNAGGTDGNQSERTADYWYQVMLGSEGEESDHLQELHEEWHDNGLQEERFAQEAAPARFNTSYLPDDDNVYNSDIRELLSRRSVSNLLQSDFRQSLDHLIQSYVERQARASVDWELDGASTYPSSPTLMEHDVQQSGIQNQGQSRAAERDPFIQNSPPVVPSQTFWDQELQDDTWSQTNLHQRLGIEWEIINDLRVDMARLQQRMNTMQRMLEACMDMQLKLQRSVQQEVSAALNRPAGSTDSDDSLQIDESRWDHVRKGRCCMCCDESIDSLLYRCGHMCTCSRCADKLVRGSGKCPMCRAPVIEMIRAYFTQ